MQLGYLGNSSVAGTEKEGDRGLRDKIQEVRGGQTMSSLEGHWKNFGSSSELHRSHCSILSR